MKSDLRVTAGTLRGRRVPLPRGEVRPTSERARQAYFNIIGGRIAGARFLDLFAGSGIFSFEALSRGAASATAVDSSKQHLAAIAKHAVAFGVEVKTVLADATLPLAGTFDLVYADPPYEFGRYDDLLAGLDGMKLAPAVVIAVEHRRHTSPFTVELEHLVFWRRTEYGEVWMTFFIGEN
ncbi:MAG: 16S rRNA (guanine(966)-N(2))-methyltransferase RsmD [Thermoanaerobaculia bacterium]